MRAEYEAYARNALVQLRRVREGTQIEEDHMRNRQMIVRWLMANTKAIDVRTRDGKTYYVMTDPVAFRDGVGRLLAEVQRIKGEGDYDAARALFETYGVHFDPALRDEVVARVDQLQLPSYTGFVMPRLDAIAASIRRDHRRHDLLPAGSHHADARILGGHAPPACVMLGALCPLRVLRALCVLCFLWSSVWWRVRKAGATTRLAILDAEDRRAPTARDLTILRSGARSGNRADRARGGPRARAARASGSDRRHHPRAPPSAARSAVGSRQRRRTGGAGLEEREDTHPLPRRSTPPSRR